jgi:hypothetical protein
MMVGMYVYHVAILYFCIVEAMAGLAIIFHFACFGSQQPVLSPVAQPLLKLMVARIASITRSNESHAILKTDGKKIYTFACVLHEIVLHDSVYFKVSIVDIVKQVLLNTIPLQVHEVDDMFYNLFNEFWELLLTLHNFVLTPFCKVFFSFLHFMHK